MAHFKFKVFLNLIRALFPKWNFFDRIAYTFELQYKLKSSNSWQKIVFEHNYSTLGLFVNEKYNLSLAHFNIVEHFASDIQDPYFSESAAPDLPTYKLLKSLLAVKISELGLSESDLQFKIVAVSSKENFDLYTSRSIKINPVSNNSLVSGPL